MERADGLRALGAILTLVVGAVHLQQYLSFIKDVPTIGVLFLLNALGAGVLCVLLGTPARFPLGSPTRLLGALGGIGLSAGALVGVLISRYAATGLFDYRETTFRIPIVIAMAAEVAAVAVLASYLLRRRSVA